MNYFRLFVIPLHQKQCTSFNLSIWGEINNLSYSVQIHLKTISDITNK